MNNLLPLHMDADNLAAPDTIWDDASAAYQKRRAEAMRDLGNISDDEMAKIEHRLELYNTVTLTNPFIGQMAIVTKNSRGELEIKKGFK